MKARPLNRRKKISGKYQYGNLQNAPVYFVKKGKVFYYFKGFEHRIFNSSWTPTKFKEELKEYASKWKKL